MVEVILAGFNVDAEAVKKTAEVAENIRSLTEVLRNPDARAGLSQERLDEMLDAIQFSPDIFSPETVPASYARISRDPRDIPELRKDAREDVKGSRASNRTIIFDMGHKSVGNHANFNFDILHLSRLAAEWLEARRIGSGYTEKSQRYITLKGDYVMPAEFSPEDRVSFRNLVENVQNRFYAESLDSLISYHFEHNPDLAKSAAETTAKGVPDKSNRAKNTLEGWGKEDARYALGLAVEAQVGTTFSATALEHAIRNMKYSELAEVRELAQKLFDVTKDIAPSLILYTDPVIFQKSFKGKELHDENFRDTPGHIRQLVADTLKIIRPEISHIRPADFYMEDEGVTFVHCTSLDVNVMAALFFTNSDLDMPDSYRAAQYLGMNPDKAMDFMRSAWQHVTEFDNPPREFEHGSPLVYAMDISSSCYAQLKRHRMMTLTAQAYNPDLGFTCPESIRAVGLEPVLAEVVERSSNLHREFQQKYGRAAEYCLTNAHKRRVLVSINPRELNHMARQRCDSHAQWDIRDKAHKMVALARQSSPLSLLMCCGRDEYDALRKEVYGKKKDI